MQLLPILSKISIDAAYRTSWLEALRSGKYKQTKNTLRTPEGFCCLGVLCDIHDKHQSRSTAWIPVCDWDDEEIVDSYEYCGEQTDISYTIRQEFFPALNGEFIDPPFGAKLDIGNFIRNLMHLNDVQDYSFAQIADYIEEHTIGV